MKTVFNIILFAAATVGAFFAVVFAIDKLYQTVVLDKPLKF